MPAKNLKPFNQLEMKKVPLLGKITCPEPLLAMANIESYVNLDASVDADFAIRCMDYSMINARIFPDDIIFIKKQTTVENGDIAAVLTRGSDTAIPIRVHFDTNCIKLHAENPLYSDVVLAGEKMNDVRIIGKAVAFLSAIK